MRMDFDFGRPASPAGDPAGGCLEWLGLRARLAAVYAARPALDRAFVADPMGEGGSFDRGCALSLATFGKAAKREQECINPSALGNRKRTYDNDAAVAGAHVTGDRGLK